jgi:hypothetical protein
VGAHIQDASFKLFDVPPILLGKSDLDLTDDLAGLTLDPLHRQLYDNELETKSGSEKSSIHGAAFDDLARTAIRASQRGWILFDGENDFFPDVCCFPMFVASDVQGMIQ